jgi:hypothetical protein
MKILIVGNCQSGGFGRVFKKMLPNDEVSSFTISNKNLPRILASAAESHITFSQGILNRTEISDQIEDALTQAGNVHKIPRILFNGYFPDVTFVPDLTSKTSASPADYHSAIAIAGFLDGRSPRDTARLYNAFVYASLGYFDAFAIARDVFLKHCMDLGLDMSAKFDSWGANGPFMYAINHPSIRVIADIAYAAAEKAGLNPQTIDPDTVVDNLKLALNWPIYPGIAKKLGVQGSMRITRSREGKELDISWDDYLQNIHAVYASIDPERLRNPQVQKVLNLLDRGRAAPAGAKPT